MSHFRVCVSNRHVSNRVLLTHLALTPLSRSLHSIYIPYANMFARVAPITVLYLFIFSLNQEQIIALSIGKLSTKQTQRKSKKPQQSELYENVRERERRKERKSRCQLEMLIYISSQSAFRAKSMT